MSESNFKPTEDEKNEAIELLKKYERGEDNRSLIERLADHEKDTGFKRADYKVFKIGDKRGAGISPNAIGAKVHLLEAIVARRDIASINDDMTIEATIKNFQDALRTCWQTYNLGDGFTKVFTWPPDNNEASQNNVTKNLKYKKSVGQSLAGTKWAVYFLFYKDEGEKHNEGLIGRATMNINHDGENGVTLENTELDDVKEYEGTYKSHIGIHHGIAIFDLEADFEKEQGRNIHVKVYCRSKEQELLLGQYTTYENGCIQSGNVIFENITKEKLLDADLQTKPGAFSLMYNNGAGYNKDNIEIEYIKFLSIRSESYNKAPYYGVKTLDDLKKHLKIKRQHDYLRFERFLERVRPKVFIASPTAFVKQTRISFLDKIKNHLDRAFDKKIYVDFQADKMFENNNIIGVEEDIRGHMQPYRDIEKLKRTRFYILILDDVNALSYSYMQIGIAITVCKVVILVGKKEYMSDSILNMRTGIINKIFIEKDLEEEIDEVLSKLTFVMKKRLPKSFGGAINPLNYG